MCWKKNVLCLFLTLSYQQHIPCEPVFTILLFSFSVDGVFGRCQELAGADLHTYDISSSALQRLRILLQKLAHRGLTWQDDITQQVISRELSKLKNVPLRHQATPPSPPDHLTAFTSSRDRKLRPAQAELSRNLQQYLTGLGFLTHAEVDGQPGVQREGGWKETTIYSLQKGAGQPPVTKVFTKSGEGRHPKLSTTYSNRDPGRSKLLSSHLEQLLAEAPGTQQGVPGGEASWPKGKLHYLSYVRPLVTNILHFGFYIYCVFLSAHLNACFHHGLSFFFVPCLERFIQNVVNQLGSHSINMDALMGKDLDHLAQVITGALQEVDEEQPVAGPQPLLEAADPKGDREPLAATQLNQDQDLKSDKGQEPNQKDTLTFFSKLLDYLNLEPFGDAPEVNSGQPAPLQKMVGLESVQSRTTQGQAPVPHRWEEKVGAEPVKEGSTLRLIGGAEGPDTQVDSEIEKWMQGIQAPAGKKQLEEPEKKDMRVKTQLVHVGVKEFSSRGKDRHFGYIITGSDSLTTDQGLDLMERLTQKLNLHAADLTQLSYVQTNILYTPALSQIMICLAVYNLFQQKQQLEKETGLKIVEAGVSDRGSLTQIPVVKETRVESGQFLLLSVLCMLFILVALAVSATFFCVRQRSHLHMKEKLASLGTDTSTDATATYQELCRQRMAIRTSERVERPETLRHSRLNSVSSQFSDGPAASPSTRSSTSSWCEEPVPSNMDISTGHMILSYMEDHLKNKNRLEREWEALCSYQAEPSACSVGQGEQNSKRNRSDAVVVYDHSRITLKAENNHGNSDYINASPIMDHDPRNPTYIASQGPLPSTVADFWQMVWESGCVVIVMLTPLSENGVKQCHHYWPDEGSDVYHIYEVNLVSEHIWCEDFLVRSFYLKNLQTNETRTVTQFHFLSWMDRGIPSSARTLLDFRRKVNKCYRGRSCPIIVHCSDGAGRSGTYILIDMVLNRMAKGAKEIDIAATLEHLRDQRAGMVQTKEQFEFALTAVAEEVNAILKALPQ
uniref:Protein tyrosine phosphatase receptor type N2 n=1 Tax=Lates calcarifer TaxID=8187 RepID=A0A4W6FJG6_LATCA